MPEIKSNYIVEQIAYDKLVVTIRNILGEMEFSELSCKLLNEVPKTTLISTEISSMWGWGKMFLEVLIEETTDNQISVSAKGYIAQLAVSPLTQKMDKFALNLATELKEKYGYQMNYEKLTKFFSMPKLYFNKTDKIIFGGLISSFFAAVFLEIYFRTVKFSWIMIIGLIGYFLIMKIIRRNKI